MCPLWCMLIRGEFVSDDELGQAWGLFEGQDLGEGEILLLQSDRFLI